MIKKLKQKFILTIMSLISLLLILILLSINIILNVENNKRNLDYMKEVAFNDGIPFMKKPSFKPNHTKKHNETFRLSFCVKLDNENNVIETISPLDLTYYEEEISDLIDSVINSNKECGSYNNISFLKKNKPYGKIIVFLDITNTNNFKLNLLYISLGVFVASLIFIFIIAYFLTSIIIKPVKENFEMQKQFIANASHELKTPLSVISTNVSILSYEDNIEEQKKWVQNVKNEVFKMNDLINKLLMLSKVEDVSKIITKENVDISNLILNSLLSYESVVYDNKQILKYNIKPNINLCCNKDDINTIIHIFLDNAIKYSSKNDIIEVNLTNNNNQTQLSIFNTGIGIKNEDINHIFDRFYRADASRNKEIEGYGLGLSIAKKIIDNNKWKIKVESVYENFVKFTIFF